MEINLATIDFKGSGGGPCPPCPPCPPLPDQSDATITPSSVLSGFIGYNNLNRVVGTYTPASSGDINQMMIDYRFNESIFYVQEEVGMSGAITSGWTSYSSSAITSSSPTYFIPNLPFTTTNANNMFNRCSNIRNTPILNLSGVTTAAGLFENCTNLTNANIINTSQCVNFSYLFSKTSLSNPILFDTSNGIVFNAMFSGCTSLIMIPEYDLSSATAITNMLNDCGSLISVPALNIPNVNTNFTYSNSPFRGNSNATATTNNYPNFTDFGGFIDLHSTMFLNGCQSLSVQSIYNILNGLRDMGGQTSPTLHLGTTLINRITADNPTALSIAVNKNWNVS